MASTIFQPEISILESEVAALQAQLASAQQRMSQFNEIEFIASGWLEAGLTLKEKVSVLAPSAIAKLKQTVLQSLFGGNDALGSDDGGNQPVSPAPQPDGNGVIAFDLQVPDVPVPLPFIEIVPQPEPQSEPEAVLCVATEAESQPELEVVEAIAPQPEATNDNHGTQVIHTAQGEVKFHLH